MKYIILFCLLNTAAYSQPKPVKPTNQNDPEAEKYLKGLKSKYAQLHNYKLTYKMIITDANNKVNNVSGIYLGSGEKYSISVDHTKSITDGKTFWSVDSKNKEIQINASKPTKKGKIESPIDIIKQYNKLFKYRVKEPISNGTIILELIPLEKNSTYFKIDIHIDVKNNRLTSAKVYDKGGHRIQFNITKTEENLKLPIDVFQVKSENFKDYEIMDMR